MSTLPAGHPRMLSASQLAKILSDPETDAAYFAKYSEMMRWQWPALSDEELRERWIKLKADAGIVA